MGRIVGASCCAVWFTIGGTSRWGRPSPPSARCCQVLRSRKSLILQIRRYTPKDIETACSPSLPKLSCLSCVGCALITSLAAAHHAGIGRQTGATLEQQKWLVPPRATGFGLGSIVGGWLLERADGHRIMAAAAGATTVVNIVMAMASSFELVVAMQLCYGLLGGGSEVVINTLTLQCALA